MVEGVFDQALECLQELGAEGAIDHPVIDRERARHHGGDGERAVLDHRPLLGGADGEDHRLRRVDDRREFLDAVHAEVGDAEGAALILLRCKRHRLGAGAPGKLPHLG